jgi:hypothetical protein
VAAVSGAVAGPGEGVPIGAGPAFASERDDRAAASIRGRSPIPAGPGHASEHPHEEPVGMRVRGCGSRAVGLAWAVLAVAVPAVAGQIRGEIKSIDPAAARAVIHDEETKEDVTVSLAGLRAGPASGLGKGAQIKDLKPGVVVVINEGVVASSIEIAESRPKARGPILQEFWHNFTHNLFKPLLLFFYLGFLVPILKVEFEFPYVMYQALTIYLLLAIGWHGGEELARIDPKNIGSVAGFMVLGFVLNFFIGVIAYLLLGVMTRMRRIDKATVAGYYGSDSAGTFATCVGVLGTVGMRYDAYMPVMLAVMEIPGCLVALYLVARLRHKGMDPEGNMPDEPGYNPDAAPVHAQAAAHAQHPTTALERQVEQELEMALEKREHPDPNGSDGGKKPAMITRKLLHEVFLNPGLYLLFGGIAIGLISQLQGAKVTRDDDNFFLNLFQGVLCLFLLEMGMTASRKLRDLKAAGPAFIVFGLVAPNLFATIGIMTAHVYAHLTHTAFQPGSYVLFAVLCGAASYIAVPAVQRLAIPEASPTLPLAASLGLTFSFNVTIGIPIYIEIANAVIERFPVT